MMNEILKLLTSLCHEPTNHLLLVFGLLFLATAFLRKVGSAAQRKQDSAKKKGKGSKKPGDGPQKAAHSPQWRKVTAITGGVFVLLGLFWPEAPPPPPPDRGKQQVPIELPLEDPPKPDPLEIWSSHPLTELANERLAYADGPWVYDDVPDEYAGLIALRTSNADRKRPKGAPVSFTVNRPVTVYVAHDSRLDKKPEWLGSWKPTQDELTVKDGEGSWRLRLYEKDFKAGPHTLGPNVKANMITKWINRGHMYTVVIRSS